MKLENWLIENRWTATGFSNHLGVSRTALLRALNKREGGISLQLALMIEKETKGKVKCEDLAENLPILRTKKRKKKNENDENTDNITENNLE